MFYSIHYPLDLHPPSQSQQNTLQGPRPQQGVPEVPSSHDKSDEGKQQSFKGSLDGVDDETTNGSRELSSSFDDLVDIINGIVIIVKKSSIVVVDVIFN